MRMYDVNITLHLSCCAHNIQEAECACIDRFREGAYNKDEVTTEVWEQQIPKGE